LNTLTLVDIATGWLECMPLLGKSADDVIDGLRVADELLPFTVQGLDTDCGSEFINYELLDYCEDRLITLTRARTHRKNDQAKTPYQWIILSGHIGQTRKDLLTQEYQGLDPVDLLKRLEILQDQPWQYSWSRSGNAEAHSVGGSKDEVETCADNTSTENTPTNRYYRANKKKKPVVRIWRTRKDPFENVWDEIRLRLELIPEMTARDTIGWLMKKYSGQFSIGQVRPLQRRFSEWRQEQLGQEARLRALMLDEQSEPNPLTAITQNLTDNLDNDHGEAKRTY